MGHIQISEEDILSAVTQKLGNDKFNLISYVLNPVEEKLGLLADHAFLNVTILNNSNEARQVSFFVKLFPKSEAQATFAQGAGAFEKEEFTYELFADFVQKGVNLIEECTGRWYVTKPNRYIIFDNLKEAGYEVPNKMEYLDYNSLLVVIHSLAQLHASSLIFEEKMSEKTKKKYSVLDGNEENFREMIYRDAENFINKNIVDATLKCILEEIKLFNFPEVLNSGKNFSEVAKKLYSKIYELVKPSDKYRNVICHGDLWPTNFMFKHDKSGKPVSCKIIDFQSVRYVPPAHDILCVVYLTTSREFRQKYLYEIMRTYYGYLEDILAKSGYAVSEVLPFDEFTESFEEQKIFSVLFVAGLLPLVLSNGETIRDMLGNAELYRKIFREDRRIVLANNANNKKYITRLTESVVDLKEECEKL